MDKKVYTLIENYMLASMCDSAHDKDHVYRVLYTAMEIASSCGGVNKDILIAACLLHDIGRKEQLEDPTLCHATVGADKAYAFLTENGFDPEFAESVKACIQTHRFRKNSQPQSIEAKILFDADKLDVSGAIGIARTLVYKGTISDPLYSLNQDGTVSDGSGDEKPSFFQEYKYKLEKLYSNFYTGKGAQMANERRQAAVDFYESLYKEMCSSYGDGKTELENYII